MQYTSESFIFCLEDVSLKLSRSVILEDASGSMFLSFNLALLKV